MGRDFLCGTSGGTPSRPGPCRGRPAGPGRGNASRRVGGAGLYTRGTSP